MQEEDKLAILYLWLLLSSSSSASSLSCQRPNRSVRILEDFRWGPTKAKVKLLNPHKISPSLSIAPNFVLGKPEGVLFDRNMWRLSLSWSSFQNAGFPQKSQMRGFASKRNNQTTHLNQSQRTRFFLAKCSLSWFCAMLMIPWRCFDAVSILMMHSWMIW